MSDKENKEKEKINWKAMLVDKLIIGGIIVAFTAYLQFNQSTELEEIQKKNKILLDSIKHTQQVYLSLLEKEKELELQERKEEFELFLQTFLKNQDLQNTIRSLNIQFEQDKEKIQKQFENDNLKLLSEIKGDEEREIDKARLQYVTSQLKEFYWPILIRLEKNNAIYNKLDDSFIGQSIDESVILPNHLEIVKILEDKMHLAQADSAFLNEIAHYVGHVYTYQSLRKGGYTGYPKEYRGRSYRSEFFKVVKTRTNFFQEEYNDLIFKYDSVEIPIKRLYLGFKDRLLSTSQFIPNLKLRRQEFEIKLAYNKEFYVKSIGNPSDSVILSFQGYNDKTNSCKFRIGTRKKENWNFKKDIGSNNYSEELNIEEEQTKKYQNSKKNYRLLLKKTWKEGRRRKALVQVEIWDRVK